MYKLLNVQSYYWVGIENTKSRVCRGCNQDLGIAPRDWYIRDIERCTIDITGDEIIALRHYRYKNYCYLYHKKCYDLELVAPHV